MDEIASYAQPDLSLSLSYALSSGNTWIYPQAKERCNGNFPGADVDNLAMNR